MAAKLSEYEFNITYKPGKVKNNADALSRNPPEIPTYPMPPAIPMIKPIEQLQCTDIRKVNDDT